MAIWGIEALLATRSRVRKGALLRQCGEVASQLRSPSGRSAWRAELAALTQGVRRASWLWHAYAQRELSLWNCLEHWAARRPTCRAFSDETESIDWITLRDRATTGAARLVELGIKEGAHVAIVAENSVSLVVALFAIQAAGAVAIPLDPRSSQQPLLEILEALTPSLVLHEDAQEGHELPSLRGWRSLSLTDLQRHGPSFTREKPRIRGTYGRNPFAILATSGTTGKPKTVVISNARCVLSGFGIAGCCLALTEKDAVYCPLPLSHATALMTGFSAAIVSGCAFVMRRRFVPDEFWRDVATANATCLLYVGELVRALLSAPSKPEEKAHTLRLVYGNGMRLDVWHRFQARFGIARIVEYYGATELPLALVNLAAEPGFMGHTPLGQLSPWRIVARDEHTGELVRDSDGICASCPPECSGELVLLTRWWEKYLWDRLAGDNDRLEHMQRTRDVASLGDAGIRTGDIVRRDATGYIKFEDRTFEVFRQQGHNVTTSRLERLIDKCEGVSAVAVTHLTLPKYDGQLGLAVVVPASNFAVESLARFYGGLAPFERPRFLRLTNALRLNRSLKFDHAFYRSEGVHPETASEPTFVFQRGAFEPISAEIWAKLEAGELRF